MNFRNFFKTLKKKNNDYSMATFGALVKIPKRENYSDETSNLKIDGCKNVFLDILSQNMTLTSNHLHDNNIQNELNMNLELLMNLSMNEEKEILSNEEKRIRSLIVYAKLELYLKKIVELENQIKFKIIALGELQKELLRNVKIKHIINRRNCIKDEINNLLGILCILENQKYAIYHKVEACSTEFKTINMKDGNIKSNYLDMRYQKLVEYADVLLTDKEIDDANNFSEVANKIASLERFLEIYVYKNNIDIDEARILLKEDANFLIESAINYVKPKEFNADDLRKLEIRFRVFDEFGKDIVSMEDLYNLYKLKFDYTVVDIYKNHDKPLFLSIEDEQRDFIEYSIYGQIIMEMIEDLLTDKGRRLSKQFGTQNENFWLYFNSMLNPSNNNIENSIHHEYDVNDILTNNLSLAFLLATHSFQLDEFFHKYKIETPQYLQKVISVDTSNNHDNFSLEEKIPLDTFIKIFQTLSKLYYVDHHTRRSISGVRVKTLADYAILEYYQKNILITLSNLYPMIYDDSLEYRSYAYDKYHHMPEGINCLLRLQEPSRLTPVRLHIIDMLSETLDNKYVYTPQSLRELNTSFFDNIKSMIDLILNEGLEKFYIDKRSNLIKVKRLVIPSTLEIKEYDIKGKDDFSKEKKSLFGFDSQYLKTINFTNFKESIILNDKEKLKNILSKVISIKANGLKYSCECSLERIIVWVQEYGVGNYFAVNKVDIEKIIKDVTSSNYGIYTKAVKYDYEKRIFIDLVVEKIIALIYKESGFMICNNENTKKLTRKR